MDLNKLDKKVIIKRLKEREVFVYIFMFFTIFLLGYLFYDDVLPKDTRDVKVIDVEDCTNLSLKETAWCLRDYVDSIFKYNPTQDGRIMTLQEIKEEGGDCETWSYLYISMAKELGFKGVTQKIRIGYDEELNKIVSHMYAVIYDDTGYCVLDMDDYPDCKMFSDDWKEGRLGLE